MDNHERALAILKEARDLLTSRLIDMVVDADDGILEDADGCSYMDEIETLQEKVGGRLNIINGMIANMPAAKPKPAAGKPASPVPSVPKVESVAEGAVESSAAPPQSGVVPPMKFALFAQQIAANDVEEAGRTLIDLLNVDESLALRCATHFRDRLNEDPMTIQKTMQLRSKLSEGKHNDSLMILWDCFGLQGLQAVSAMATLKASLTIA